MTSKNQKHRKPSITVTKSDYERLALIAASPGASRGDVADELQTELDRALVVVDTEFPPGVIRMGSTALFSSDLGEARQVRLVFPADADIAEGKVSILTPIGVALLGLSAGQSIDWATRDGTVHRLTVLNVEPPRSAPTDDVRMRPAI